MSQQRSHEGYVSTFLTNKLNEMFSLLMQDEDIQAEQVSDCN